MKMKPGCCLHWRKNREYRFLVSVKALVIKSKIYYIIDTNKRTTAHKPIMVLTIHIYQ